MFMKTQCGFVNALRVWKSEEVSVLHWFNWVVIGAYFAVMAGMGFYFMRRNKSSDAYFKAGGKLPWWVVSLSI